MAGEWGDLVSLDYEQPQQEDYSNYSFSAPQSGWSFGQDLGSADFQMPDFSQYVPDMGTFETYSTGMPQSSYVSPSDYLSSPDAGNYSTTPGMSEMASPAQSIASVGQPGPGGSFAGNQEDDWKKMLMKGGMGIGTSLAGTGLSALLKSAMEPAQKGPEQAQMAPASPLPLPPTPVGTYQMAPMEPLPGTKASPLISGGPKQINMTQGLVNDRIKRGGSAGGFQMY